MRADRLVATLLTLQARGRVTAAELAEELEVSVATARRDLEALSAAGIPVYPQPGRGGGWSLLGGARTDLSGLTGRRGAGAVPARRARGIRRPRGQGRAAQARAGPARDVPGGCRGRRRGDRDRRRRVGRARPPSAPSWCPCWRRRSCSAGACACATPRGPGAGRPRSSTRGASSTRTTLVPARAVDGAAAHLPRRPDARGRSVTDEAGRAPRRPRPRRDVGAGDRRRRTAARGRVGDRDRRTPGSCRSCGPSSASARSRRRRSTPCARACGSPRRPSSCSRAGSRAGRSTSRSRRRPPLRVELARLGRAIVERNDGVTCSYEQGACPAPGGMIQWPRAKHPSSRSSRSGASFTLPKRPSERLAHMSTARRIAAGAVGLGLVLTGLSAAPAYAAPTEVQILATNDFHGRILATRRRRGRRGGARRRREAAARERTRTRSSPQPATSSAPRPSSRSSSTTSPRSTRSTPRASRSRPSATTSSTRATTTSSTG